ncbi:nucleic acid/nucleotide deaminase domain-containing protein [Streptomyces sp. NPDC046977]|uniref:WXG100-like domain-containing protein n=1 Tax=Streptomyces sp. NPDC046977 TaxID=3154703 RepID=UPI0033FC19ED
MGVVLPDELAWLLDLIGIMWPNVDEDDYREMATALREFADDVDHGGGGLHEAVAGLLGATEGPAVDAFNSHWNKVGSHLGNLADAGRLGATALDGVALVVEGAKIAAVVQLGILAAEVIAAQAAAPFTLGLSELGAAGATQATRLIVKRLFKEAAQQALDQVIGLATGPVYAALGTMAGDLAIQLGANALGIQHGVDLGRAADAGKGGFEQGVEDSRHQLTGAKDGSFVLASAGGGSGGGGSGSGGSDGAGSGQIRHDESAYADFDTQVDSHGQDMRSRGSERIRRAHERHARVKGKGGELTQAAEQFIETLVNGVRTGLDNATGHITGDMRRGVRQMHKNHKDNDDRTAADLEGLHKVHSMEQLRKTGDKTPVYLVDDAGRIHQISPDGKKIHVDSLPSDRNTDAPLDRDVPDQEGPRKHSTAVVSGDDELSRATQLARHIQNDYKGKNYAAFRYSDGQNDFILVGRSGGPHSERVLGVPLINSGMQHQVVDGYSERAPCRTLNRYCGEWLHKYYPDTDMSHSFEYGEDATWETTGDKKADNEARNAALRASQADGNKEMRRYLSLLHRAR